MNDEPEVRDNRATHRFEIWSGGELAGFTAYEPITGLRAFVHTEIDERFSGQGLASILIREVLTRMRDSGTAVSPFCPFIRRFILRHPEFLPLVPVEDRVRFELPTDDAAARET